MKGIKIFISLLSISLLLMQAVQAIFPAPNKLPTATQCLLSTNPWPYSSQCICYNRVCCCKVLYGGITAMVVGTDLSKAGAPATCRTALGELCCPIC